MLNVKKYSALLTTSEIGLGSLLHGLHLPFGGHLLSLNQSLILTLNLRSNENRWEGAQSTSQISLTAAFLKLLSPIGKRITPMLAILIQGLLYSLGVLLGGANLAGALLGTLLLSVWGFIQGLLTPYLIFGSSLFVSFFDLWRRLTTELSFPFESLYWLAIGIVGLKILSAMGLTVYAWKRGAFFEERYTTVIKTRAEEALPSPSRSVVQQLFRPWFVISLAITMASLWISGKPSRTEISLALLRPVVLAIVLFYFARFLLSRAKESLT